MLVRAKSRGLAGVTVIVGVPAATPPPLVIVKFRVGNGPAVDVSANAKDAGEMLIAAGAGQRPETQLIPVGQTVPQVPQLVLSVIVFTHAVPHIVSPLEQAQAPLALQVPPVGDGQLASRSTG